MRLLSRILDHRLSRQKRRRQHNVHGSTHTRHVQAHSVAAKAVRTGLQVYIIIILVHFSAQGNKPLDMLINGTGGKITAAGQCHMSLAEPAQQRTHQVIAGPHLSYQLRVGVCIVDLTAIQYDYAGCFFFYLSAHVLQDA